MNFTDFVTMVLMGVFISTLLVVCWIAIFIWLGTIVSSILTLNYLP